MEENKKPKEDILQKDYDKLSSGEEKESYMEAARKNIYNKYKKILPQGVETHSIALKNGFGCIIKSPNAKIMGEVLNKISAFRGDPDITGAGKIIYDNCLIVADQEVVNNEFFKLGIYLQCVNTVDIIEGSIKKN